MLEELDKIRAKNKITKKHVIEHIGICYLTLRKYNKGITKVPYSVIEQYADLLGYEIKLQLK